MNEEMYEEEEEEHPHRALAAAARATGSGMNARVQAYVSGKVALSKFHREADLSKFHREAEIEREFAERFGPVMASRNSTGAMYGTAPNHFYPEPTHSFAPNHVYQQYTGYPMERDRAHSVAHIPPYTATSPVFSLHSLQSRHASFDDRVSTPALSPGSTQTTTPLSSATPQDQPDECIKAEPVVDPSLGMSPADQPQSSFTQELPNDVKSIIGTNVADLLTDPLANMLMGDDGELFGSSFGPEQPFNRYMQAASSEFVDLPLQPYGYNSLLGDYPDPVQSSPFCTAAELRPGSDSPDEMSVQPVDWPAWIYDPDDKDQLYGDIG